MEASADVEIIPVGDHGQVIGPFATITVDEAEAALAPPDIHQFMKDLVVRKEQEA